MQKQKHNWNRSVKYFIFLIGFSKLHYLEWCWNAWKYPNFLMVWHELFLHTSMGVGRGATIWKFQQKKLFSYFRVLKTKFHHFWPPLEKRFEKSTSGSPGKIPSDAHAHKYVKFQQFCEKLCCIIPSDNTVQQHQCGRPKQSTAGRQTVHGVFCQTITESCRNTAKLEIISTKYCQNSATFFSLKDLL